MVLAWKKKQIHPTSLELVAAASLMAMRITLVTQESRRQGDLQKANGEKMVWGPEGQGTKRP